MKRNEIDISVQQKNAHQAACVHEGMLEMPKKAEEKYDLLWIRIVALRSLPPSVSLQTTRPTIIEPHRLQVPDRDWRLRVRCARSQDLHGQGEEQTRALILELEMHLLVGAQDELGNGESLNHRNGEDHFPDRFELDGDALGW